jgi:hypothetical protein
MSRVHSRNLTSGAPISRTYLDAARTPLRVFFGVVFVSYCAISTVVGFRDDLAPLAWSVVPIVGSLTVGLALGLALAAGIFVGEVLLAESALLWYVPLLAVDAWYTARWSEWIGTLIRAHMQASAGVEDVIAFLAIWGASLAVSYFGERLIFGKRRRKSHD